jgi:hypothetical protein
MYHLTLSTNVKFQGGINMKFLLRTLCVMLSFGMIACGGSDSTDVPESTTTLTSSEQEAVGEAVNETVPTNGFDNSLTQSLKRQLSNIDISTKAQSSSSTDTSSCDEGGTITTTTSGSSSDINQASTNFSVTAESESVFDNCQVRDNETNNVLTLNGTINGDYTVDFVLDEELENQSFSIEYSVAGGLDVTGNANGAGVCGISVDANFSSDGDTFSGSSEGQICGESYSSTFDSQL